MTTAGQRLPNAPVPPQNLDAEESVLGALMLSGAAIDACAEEIGPADFYRESHGTIFRAAVALHATGSPVDAVTLTEFLASRPSQAGADKHGNELEAVGGRARLHELAALVPASSNARHYAKIVRENAVLRSLIRAGGEISRLGWDRPGPITELVERAEGLVFDLAKNRGRSDMVPASEVLQVAFERIEAASRAGRDITGAATGLTRIDAVTSGLQPGLIVVAARPSMGKSALMLGIVSNLAVHHQVPIGLFTFEMSRLEVIHRLLSMEARVESQRLRNGNLDTEQWQRLHRTGALIDAAPLFIEDSGAMTMMEVRAKSRRLKLRYPHLGLIAVDYLQLMTGQGENRVQEISQISRALKLLAGELEVPVLALSQLSRGPEQRHDKRPILSDLRDSGSIEQDADLVWFIYRDEYYNPEDPDTEGIAEVNIAKHRNGPTDTVKLAWAKRFARFADLHLPGDTAL